MHRPGFAFCSHVGMTIFSPKHKVCSGFMHMRPALPSFRVPGSERNAGRAISRAVDANALEAQPTQPGTAVIESMDLNDYPTLLYTIVTRDGNAAVKWYEKALNAETKFLYLDDSGKVMHSILRTAYGVYISVEDYFPQWGLVSPVPEERAKSNMGDGSAYVYVTIPEGSGTADDAVEAMRKAGANVVAECEDMFYGHRLGKVIDCYGVGWMFAHRIDMGM